MSRLQLVLRGQLADLQRPEPLVSPQPVRLQSASRSRPSSPSLTASMVRSPSFGSPRAASPTAATGANSPRSGPGTPRGGPSVAGATRSFSRSPSQSLTYACSASLLSNPASAVMPSSVVTVDPPVVGAGEEVGEVVLVRESVLLGARNRIRQLEAELKALKDAREQQGIEDLSSPVPLPLVVMPAQQAVPAGGSLSPRAVGASLGKVSGRGSTSSTSKNSGIAASR